MKKRIRKTGEIVDVIAWYNIMGAERDKDDSVSYIDSKGNECVKVEGLNLAWDFEDVVEVPNAHIDWEQRRYEVAKDMLSMFFNIRGYNGLMRCFRYDDGNSNPYQGFAETSVQVADALIAELKKGGEK